MSLALVQFDDFNSHILDNSNSLCNEKSECYFISLFTNHQCTSSS